jgi:metal-responsive CopG/Arc/MetJ family transcriptional regulator
VNTQSDISNKIIKCSQENKLEILISLRAFLLGLEDCPWFIFFSNDNKSEIIKKANKKNLQYYKKINESNLRKIQIKPIDIFLLPKNKKNQLIQMLIVVVISTEPPP